MVHDRDVDDFCALLSSPSPLESVPESVSKNLSLEKKNCNVKILDFLQIYLWQICFLVFVGPSFDKAGK